MTGSVHAQSPSGNAAADAANLDLARSVAVTGREAFNSGDYETALALFRRAYSLYPAPTVVLYEARTLEKMGLLIEAVDAYARTATIAVGEEAPAQFAEAAAQAREEGDALRTRIPTLVIELRGASLSDPTLVVRINGREQDASRLGRAQRLNPGTYRIEGAVASARRASAEVTLVPGQSRRVELSLAEATPGAQAAVELPAFSPVGAEPPRHRSIPTLAYVAGGVGVIGASAGVITGLVANGKYEEAERICGEEHRSCPNMDAVDEFRTWRMISSISYGVGAVGLAAGVVLWLTAGDDEAAQTRSIQPWGTAKTAGIRGTF
ncbi:MAG TPA: hypothetical protein VNN80_11340 [Polyangiaceae bacterium]|nr:hypothetical protein [Polyangiaceae bacterium]